MGDTAGQSRRTCDHAP